MISLDPIDPADAPAALGGYTQALSVRGASHLLFLSGQIPVARDGAVPQDFEAQCRQAWANVIAALRAAGLEVQNLVKVTTYLSDRRHAETNSAVRREIIADIYDPDWLLEIEAIAAA